MSTTREHLQSALQSSLEKRQDVVLIQDDQVAWSGAQISAHVQRLRILLDEHTPANSRIGISFPNRAVDALSVLAVLLSGRIPVIISFKDLKAEPQAWIERSDISLLLTAKFNLENLNLTVPVATLSMLDASLEDWQVPSTLAPRSPTQLEQERAEKNGLILFTSGSTGVPKGILVPADGILKTCEFLIDYFELSEKTIAPVLLPIHHSMALNTQFLPTFLAGGRCHFMDSALGINRLYRTLLEQNSTFVSLTGELLRVCNDERQRRQLPTADTVEHIQMAGDTINRHHIQLASELFPNAVIHKGYGLTEAIRVSMINSRDPGFLTSAVGHPLPFVDVQIRDNHGKSRSKFRLGQIHVKGPSVLLGYSGANARPVDKDGYLATGDLGYFNGEGQVCVYGRADGFFKINGRRISGFEIERLATETSDLIRTAKCLALEDSKRAGKKIVLLLEVPTAYAWRFLNNEFKNLQNIIHQKFQSLSHLPKEVIILENFPRTSNGKVAIRQLADLYMNSKKTMLAGQNQTGLCFFSLLSNGIERVEA